MIFNSIEFLVFLPIVFVLYWFVFKKNLRLQNFFVVAASYFFLWMVGLAILVFNSFHFVLQLG